MLSVLSTDCHSVKRVAVNHGSTAARLSCGRRRPMLTQHIEFAGGGGGAYLVLRLAGVLSDVGLGGLAELQTGHALHVL